MKCCLCDNEVKNRKKPFCHDCLPTAIYNKGGRSALSPLWKAYSVKSKGGSCSLCGYNSCQAALDFHHTEAGTKESTIVDLTRKSGVTKEELDKELEKCILVCRNCHAEIHYFEKEKS